MSPLADVRFETLAGVVVARLEGEVDMTNAGDLVELRERLTRRGQEIRIVLAADSPVATALEYAGVQHTLGVADTVQGAIDDLEG